MFTISYLLEKYFRLILIFFYTSEEQQLIYRFGFPLILGPVSPLRNVEIPPQKSLENTHVYVTNSFVVLFLNSSLTRIIT